MEILQWIFSFVLLIFLVWLTKTINRYSKENYRYTPINFATIFLVMIPHMLLLAGLFYFKEASILVFVFSAISTIGIFWWIKKQSSFYIALGSTMILLTFSILMFIVLILASQRSSSYFFDD